jgi:hypothetical protein
LNIVQNKTKQSKLLLAFSTKFGNFNPPIKKAKLNPKGICANFLNNEVKEK